MTFNIELTGDWEQAREYLAAAPQDIDDALDAAVRALAEYFVGRIKKKIGSNVGPPNAKSTVMQKKRSKTLIDTGDMRNAVTVVDAGKHSAFIGIPRNASARRGGSIANLAEIHEKGRTIVQAMTPKQRRFLAALFKNAPPPTSSKGTGVIVIHIPARPFIAPVFEEEAPQAAERFGKLVLANLRSAR